MYMKVKLAWGGITMNTFSRCQKPDKEAWKLEWATDSVPPHYWLLLLYFKCLFAKVSTVSLCHCRNPSGEVVILGEAQKDGC